MDKLSQVSVEALVLLKEALGISREMLSFCNQSSKVYLVLEREQHIKMKFQELKVHFEQDLSGSLLNKFEISDEVKEQPMWSLTAAFGHLMLTGFYIDTLKILVDARFCQHMSEHASRSGLTQSWDLSKAQQILCGTTLAPNYALCSLVSNWCMTNGMDTPKDQSLSSM